MAIAVDATSEVFDTSAGTTTDLSHTVSGDDRVLVVVIHTNSGTVSGVTYNGTSMTLVDSQQASPDAIWVYVYVLANPDTGANNITVTHTDGCDRVIGGISFTGANPSDPIGATDKVSDLTSQTSLGLTITPEVSAGYIVDIIRTQNPLTVGSGQTRFVTQDSFNGSRSAGASYESHSGSDVDMDWTFSSSNLNIMIAVEVKELQAETFVPSMTIF